MALVHALLCLRDLSLVLALTCMSFLALIMQSLKFGLECIVVAVVVDVFVCEWLAVTLRRLWPLIHALDALICRSCLALSIWWRSGLGCI